MAATKIIETSNHEFTIDTSKSVPTEIIVEILLRLPVESLLRCKSVCKLWFSLISDPDFVKSHLKLSTSNNEYAHSQLFWISKSGLKSCLVNDVLLDKSVMNVVEHDCPLTNRSKWLGITIVGCCNGLICITDERSFFCNPSIFICNPSTRMWKQLPSLGFENLYVQYGFGYDELTDDYKVVGINMVLETGFASKIFSLKSGKWKNIDCILPDGIQFYSVSKAVFSNGSIHWDAEDSKSSCDFVIVSLDLAKETYGLVAQPVYDDGDDKYLELGVLGDSLSVVCNYLGNHFDVWVMRVKDSWTKLVSIPYATTGMISVFSITNDGKVLFQLGKKLVVYDSKNKSFPVQNIGTCDRVCTLSFVESLVSPNTTAIGLAVNNADEI